MTKTTNPHGYVTTSTGERYTPKYIVAAARFVLGGNIELDPASSAKANGVIQADTFLTKDDDGLAAEWCGHVFLNPPGNCRNADGELEGCGNAKVCSCGLVGRFWNKLLLSVEVPAAIWIGFHLDQLQSLQTPLCYPTCILAKRIRYLDSNFVEMPSPPHGSYITLVTEIDEYVERFTARFAEFGQLVGPL